jgi:hypothetical protein
MGHSDILEGVALAVGLGVVGDIGVEGVESESRAA